MKTGKQTNLESRELHAELATSVSGPLEAVVFQGGLHSVVGFKGFAGSTATGVAGTWAIEDEVATLTLTAGSAVDGDVAVILDGVSVEIAVAEGDTAAEVGDKIRLETFDGYTVTGVDEEVIFTSLIPIETAVLVDLGDGVPVATSLQLQTTIDDLAHVNAGTAIWKDSGSAVASGTYAETAFAHPLTAVRLDVKTPAFGSTVTLLARE